MASSRRVLKPRDPARRRRILDAAKRHFTAYGLKGTNLDAVAAGGGLREGALYLEFASKEELLREVANETFAAIRTRFEREVMGLESPLERLVGTLRFAFQQFAAEPLFSKLIREDPDFRVLVPREAEAEVTREAKAEIAVLRAWVDEGIARGEIRADIDRDAVPAIIGVLRFAPQHLGMQSALGIFPADRTLEAILDVFRAGLAARPTPSPGAKKPSRSKRSKR